jgi:hypothetical protein
MVFAPEDKRCFPRVKVRLPLRYQARGAPEFNNVITDNISLSGVGFSSDEFIAPMTNVMLEINALLHILTPIGRVAWSVSSPHSDKYHSGIEFVELDPDQRKHLDDFISMQALRV